MPEEENAALVAKFLDELWNKQNLAVIDQLTTEDYVVHIPQGDLLGREALKIVAVHYFESFSFLHVGIGNQIGQDSQVVTHIEWDTALQLMDQSLDQEIKREIPVRGVSIDRIDKGQIAESWNMLDTLYWLFNIQELSRDPDFVQTLPASSKRPCAAGQCPSNGRCHPCKK